MSEQEQAEVMTVSEVATYLRMGKPTVYRLASKGKIPGRKIGGAWRFLKSDLDAWLSQIGSDFRYGEKGNLDA